MSNDDNVIDAEVIEIVENLPAVAETYQHSEPISKWSEQWWSLASPEVQANRCRAHKKTGERCRNAAISGATVCRFHGGAAKHVRAAARARLDNAADLMAKQLLNVALSAESESVKLAAIRDALDRTIGKAPTVVEVGPTKPFEEVFDIIGGSAGEYPDESSSLSSFPARSAPPNPTTDQREESDEAGARDLGREQAETDYLANLQTRHRD